MFIDLEEFAPYLLGMFMTGLACIPLLFVWQDRSRRRRSKHVPLPVAGRVHLASGR